MELPLLRVVAVFEQHAVRQIGDLPNKIARDLAGHTS